MQESSASQIVHDGVSRNRRTRPKARSKHISLFARGSRDLRENRDGWEVSFSRVAHVPHVLLVSLTIHERRFTHRAADRRLQQKRS